MNRLTIAVDRVVAFLVGLLLLAAGAAAAVWGTKRVPPLTGPLDLSPLSDATDKTWWPWTVGIVGAVLVVVGLRWLLSHLPRRGVGPVKLAGTGRSGRLLADGRAVAGAAADALTAAPGVRTARGTVMRERGQVIASLVAVIDPDADLAQVAQSADEVSAQLRRVLGREDLNCRIEIRVARGNKPVPRVA